MPRNYQSVLATRFGILIPPTANVAAFVRSGGVKSGDDSYVKNNLVTTVNAALKRCRSGGGDYVFVLPEHAENIAAADSWSDLVAGTNIIGIGTGNARPIFTWTTALSTVLLNVANVSIQNCILKLEPGTGTINVAAPITISAEGCSLIGNRIMAGTDANNKVTIGITTTAAADDLTLAGNRLYAATAAECTTMLQLVGADRLLMQDNVIVCATSAVAVGPIRFLTTASTDILIKELTVRNNKAASEQAITGMAGIGGMVDDLFMGVLSDAAGALTGAFSTPGNIQFGRNCAVANLIAERAALFGTESA